MTPSAPATPGTPLEGYNGGGPDAAVVLNALADPVLLVNREGGILYANHAAEEFFDMGASLLRERGLRSLVAEDSPLYALIHQGLGQGQTVAEHGVVLESPRIGMHEVTIRVAPIPNVEGVAALSLHEHSIAQRLDRKLIHRNAARSVTAMAALLAHEVRNPLSGIRGAAQLLESSATEEDKELTRLIRDETDRICNLLDRMEIFSDPRSIRRGPVNIHEVLGYVRKIATSGFARNIRFVEAYDPSLPPAYGNRDQLVQVFLNLVKNAAEVAPTSGGEIVLSTAYQHGVRLAVRGSQSRLGLPLVVSVQDNGPGIPDDLRRHLFDPFVTTKPDGSGLGLALVAKIVDDHGGAIEVDSRPRRTVFKVMLPLASGEDGPGAGTGGVSPSSSEESDHV